MSRRRLMLNGNNNKQINSLFGRNCYIGTFRPTSNDWGGILTFENVGNVQAIYVISNNPQNDGSYKKWGAVWFSEEMSGITSELSRTYFLTYANETINSAMRNTYRITSVTNESFTITAGDTSYSWDTTTDYTYIVVGDLV